MDGNLRRVPSSASCPIKFLQMFASKLRNLAVWSVKPSSSFPQAPAHDDVDAEARLVVGWHVTRRLSNPGYTVRKVCNANHRGRAQIGIVQSTI